MTLIEYERKLFGEAYSDLESKMRAHPGLSRALDALAERYTDERLAVTDLARAAGMSETILRDRFRQMAGIAPRQFIMRYRINKALGVLSRGQGNICDVAGCVGFANVSGFRKSFRNLLGGSPRMLRAQIVRFER